MNCSLFLHFSDGNLTSPRMASKCLRIVLASLLVFACFSVSKPLPADIVVVAAADGFISEDGSIDETGNFVKTQLGGGGADDRGVFEFDLSSLPDGATIDWVQFSGYSSIVTAQSLVELTGYAASSSASIDVSDYTMGGVQVGLLNAGVEIINDMDFNISLTDITTVQFAADTSGVFGIRAEMLDLHEGWWVNSLDFGSQAVPTLTIGFSTVPEPGSVGLASMALVLVVLRRRR